MTENERLKQLRGHLGLTQRAFSEVLEIKQGSYSDVERGKAGISALLIKTLIVKFRVNPLWICAGEGNMFIDEKPLSNNSAFLPTISKKTLKGNMPAKAINQLCLLKDQQQCIDDIKYVLDL